MTSTSSPLARSRALWNRDRFDLGSDEILAQILDRGDLEDWREIYRLAAHDATLRRRIVRICRDVPISMPHLFLAAMRALGEPLDPYPDVTPHDAGGIA